MELLFAQPNLNALSEDVLVEAVAKSPLWNSSEYRTRRDVWCDQSDRESCSKMRSQSDK